MRISPSSLQQFMNCPLQYKFRKIEKLPERINGKTAFGVCIHKALQIYNETNSVELAKKTFLTYWNEPELLGVKPDYWPKYTTYNGLKEKGIEMLDAYHEKKQWEKRVVITQEHHFVVPFGAHELEGIVDLVELRVASNGRRTLYITDYKTAARQPFQPELRLNVQFSVYTFGSLQPEFWLGSDEYPGVPNGAYWFKELEKVPRKPIWYHLMTNKEISAGERDDGDFMRLYRAVNEIEKAIRADIFIPDISAESCTFCSYTKECGVEIPDRDELAAELI